MRNGPSRCWRLVPAVLAVLAGCATATRRAESPAERYLRVRDSVEALTAAPTSETAPAIRIYVRPTYAPSSYVDVDFRTDDDSYALVLAIDYDNRVRVLYPETPTATAWVASRQQPELHPFFAGFGDTGLDPRYRFLRGGVVVAIASARPLQFHQIANDRGGWDERAILGLLDRINVMQGAEELGQALTLPNQDYSYDYATFNTPSARALSLASRGSIFADCSASPFSSTYYGALDPYEFYRFPLPLVRYFQIGNTLYAQYQIGSDGCGNYSAPVPVRQLTPLVPAHPDTTRRDTSAATVSMARLRDGSGVGGWRLHAVGSDVNPSLRDGALFQERALRARPVGYPILTAGSPHWRPARGEETPNPIANARVAPRPTPVPTQPQRAEPAPAPPPPVRAASPAPTPPARASDARATRQQ
ncbi:MAG TPA: hypothetical protein VGG78_06800 [Gemmatimonadaceae bacterium]